MKHLGDITKINGSDVPLVNVVIGGSPCQDLSIAGRREGLQGARSGLFMEQIRIIKEMRTEDIKRGRKSTDIRPRYMVWENVPGAFSSNRGQDFKAVLEETIGIVEEVKPDIPIPDGGWHYSGIIMGDGFSVAWRVFDAQFWGVPQRRRRIALVADFGGESAPEILFERKGVSRYSAKSLRSWQETACRAGKGASPTSLCLNDQGGNRMDVSEDVTGTLRAEAHHPPCVMENKDNSGAFRAGKHSAGFCTEHSAKSRTIGYEEEKSPTLRAGTVPAVVVLDNHPIDSRIKVSENGVFETLTSRMGTGGNNVPLVMEIRSGCEGGGKGCLIQNEKSETLTVNNDQFVITDYQNTVGSLCSSDSKGINNQYVSQGKAIITESTVRRFTPLECERLQGFPDNWTNIGDYIDTNGKKRKTSDSARYKALGNSIALPSWVWVLERLARCCGSDYTMASLFDGIGGFPLIWETLNGVGTCLWASEIEEFPIAVTKHHFKED